MSGKMLKYASEADRKFDLIEMDEQTLTIILASKGATQIKSAPTEDGSAVLCTQSSTFKLKLSETSNQLMVLNGADIISTKNVFIEVSHSRPKYQQVINYLNEQTSKCSKADILNNC